MPKVPKMPKVNVFYPSRPLGRTIYFMKIETHGKLSFHCSDSWPPILPASTTYTKDGAKRHYNFRHFRHFSAL